jgi:Nucleotidyltransferase domain
MNDYNIVKVALADLEVEFGPDLLGVAAGGSRLRGEGNANSDIDVVVVIAQPRRQRRNIVLHGVEVEMFINPLFQIHRYLREDYDDGRGLMQHLLSTAQIVFDPRGAMEALQREAIALWQAGPAPLAPHERAWAMRYAAADGLRDIWDVRDDPLRAAYLLGEQLPRVISNHYRIAGRWLVKPKRVLLDLESWDPRAAELARRAAAGPLAERIAALEALIDHTLTPLGGPMPLAWNSEWEALEP